MDDLVDWTGAPIDKEKLACDLKFEQVRPEVIDEPRGVILVALLYQATRANNLSRQIDELEKKLKRFEEA